MTPLEIAAILGAVTAFIGAVATVVRLRPDRDALIITQAQGAATIYDDLVKTLREEIVRQREEMAILRQERDAAVEECRGLRERHGTRRGDQDRG